jgi:BASS family bile acid:Na+ symporter
MKGLPMFGSKDLLLLLVIFSSLFVGVMAPEFSSFFQPYPLFCMMTLLFLSFLSIRLSEIRVNLKGRVRTIFLFLVIRMIAFPLCVGLLFKLFLPRYSLAALLLSGISTGVVAPFLSNLVHANSALVLVVVVISSLLVPFTLPTLVDVLFAQSMELSFLGMVRLLLLVVFVPVVMAELLRRNSRRLYQALLRRQYPISLALFAVTNLGIFSAYSDFFLQQPVIILRALVVALALGAIYLGAGLLISWGRPVEDQLAAVICLGIMNNVLVVVFSSRFFSPIEPMVAAMYMIPFFGLLLPMRAYRRYRLKASTRDG